MVIIELIKGKYVPVQGGLWIYDRLISSEYGIEIDDVGGHGGNWVQKGVARSRKRSCRMIMKMVVVVNDCSFQISYNNLLVITQPR